MDIYISRKKNTDFNPTFRENFLKIFDKYYFKEGANTYLIFGGLNNIKKFEDDKWNNLSNEEFNNVKNIYNNYVYDIETNNIQYYARYNILTNTFFISEFNIRDVSINTAVKYLTINEVKNFEDFKKNILNVKVDLNLNKKIDKYYTLNNIEKSYDDLYIKLVYILGMSGKKTGINCKSKNFEELIKIINNIKINSENKYDIIGEENIKEFTKSKTNDKNQYIEIILKSDIVEKNLCSYLFNFFYKNNLIIFE
jgi:hypothetical protein